MMRNAATILAILSKYGERRLPVQDVYRLLYQRDLYVSAYGKIYQNKGAMTKGVTEEIVDSMSLEKIDKIIQVIREERYQWTPVRRIYVQKKNGKRRPLGLPTWSDKLLSEVIRSILNAYYEPIFSGRSHGFRPNRGCHTALLDVATQGRASKWFIEGDLCACFDKIDHTLLLNILQENFQDNRFLRLMHHLLDAGYLEDWKYNRTLSGVPQGNNVSPILSNIILDRLDKYIEQQLIPAYTKGSRRKANRPYNKLAQLICKARKAGEWKYVQDLRKDLKSMPAYDPYDPNFRRLWYVRYADDFLLGFIGSRNEAIEIKDKVSKFLKNDLKLELNHEKTLITHARDQCAKFLGYEVHVLHEDSKRDHQGHRSINGVVGLRVPYNTKQEKCSRYMRNGKPIHLPQCIADNAFSIVTKYQAEYRGLVEYYKMAYNLSILSHLKYIMEVSLVKTLANKYKTTCAKIYKKYGSYIQTNNGRQKVILIKVDRGPSQKPLLAHFGGIPLKWDKWVSNKQLINDKLEMTGYRRNEIISRLLAQKCELCGAEENIEVHHIRKLADLKRRDGGELPAWKKHMITRQRKTLVVCRKCHMDIHYGRYDGDKPIA